MLHDKITRLYNSHLSGWRIRTYGYADNILFLPINRSNSLLKIVILQDGKYDVYMNDDHYYHKNGIPYYYNSLEKVVMKFSDYDRFYFLPNLFRLLNNYKVPVGFQWL